MSGPETIAFVRGDRGYARIRGFFSALSFHKCFRLVVGLILLVTVVLQGFSSDRELTLVERVSATGRKYREELFSLREAQAEQLSDLCDAYVAQLDDMLSDDAVTLSDADRKTVQNERLRFMTALKITDQNLLRSPASLTAAQARFQKSSTDLAERHRRESALLDNKYLAYLETLRDSEDAAAQPHVRESIERAMENLSKHLAAGSEVVERKTTVSQEQVAVSPAPRDKASHSINAPASGALVGAGVDIGSVFSGKVLQFNPETLVVRLVYDFSDPAQSNDWEAFEWSESGDEGEWAVSDGTLVLKEIGSPLHVKARFDSVRITAEFEVVEGHGNAGVVVCASEDGNFYCLFGLERGRYAILRRYEEGSPVNLAREADSPFRVYGKGRATLACDEGVLSGEVGIKRFRGKDEAFRRGYTGVFAPGTVVRLDNIVIEGVLNRRWYRSALRRAQRKRGMR